MTARFDSDSAQFSDGDSHALIPSANRPQNDRDHKSISTNGAKDGTMAKTLRNFWQSVTRRQDGSIKPSRQGWRAGMRWAAALSASALVLNISIVAIAYSLTLRQGRGKAFAQLVVGDCEKTKRLGTWIHLGINVLSSLVLGGSNYCLQCLSAPTREDVDKAHAEGFWLHIGVSNLRNFRKIKRQKFWVWAILGISSIPFHLLYNSTFYTSTMTYSYDIYFANKGFATGEYVDEDLFSTSAMNVTIRLPNGTISETKNNYGRYDTKVHEIRSLAMKGDTGPFKRLSKDQCIQKYANPLLTDRRNLILVASNSPLDNLTFNADLSEIDIYDDFVCPARPPQLVVCGPQDSQAIMTGSLGLVTCSNSSLYAIRSWSQPYAGNWDATYFEWICSQNGSALAVDGTASCGGLSNCTAETAWEKYHGAQQWTVAGFDIDYCLSETMPGECALNVGLPLLLTVIISNLVKLLAIIAAIRTIKESPLITIGDATASFIKRPDESSRGICLWSWEEVVHRKGLRSEEVASNSYDRERSTAVMELVTIRNNYPSPSGYIPVELSTSFSDARQRRYKAVTNRRWAVSGFLLTTAFLVIIVLFCYAMSVLQRRNVSSVWKLGIGTVQPETLISGWAVATSGNAAVVQTVFIANLPQLLLSFLYFVLNSLFTSMAVATEWNHYGQRRGGLRVSQRRSQEQRTTYFLQLPYRLGIPLLCLSTLLHWMISQTIFLVQIHGKAGDGTTRNLDNSSNDPDVITCGYSPLGMVITLAILVALMGFAIGFGVRRLAPGIPMAGSCSMAIAAACHVPEGTSELLPVKWGVISEDLIGDGQNIGHCSFSNDEVDSPTVGKVYA